MAPAGVRLTTALALPPITREKADIILEEFLKRVVLVNARDELTHYVASVGVFGSYNKKSAKDLADIDICLDLRERKIAGRDPLKC